MVGDIICIQHPTALVEYSYQGEPSKAYQIVWKFVKHTFERREMSARELEDLRYAAAEENFWNDYYANLNGEE